MSRTLILFSAVILSAVGRSSSSDDYKQLYLLEIKFPPSVGRMESSDVMTLYSTITNMEGVETIFFLSEVGNSRLFAVLDIEDVCTWVTLSDVLSKAGVEVKTEPVVSCYHFAQELNANVTKYKPFKNPVAKVVNTYFLDKGMTEEEYNNVLREHTEHAQEAFYKNGWELNCVRPAVQMPERVVYFTNEPLKATFKLATSFSAAETMRVQELTVIDLQRTSCYEH